MSIVLYCRKGPKERPAVCVNNAQTMNNLKGQEPQTYDGGAKKASVRAIECSTNIPTVFRLPTLNSLPHMRYVGHFGSLYSTLSLEGATTFLKSEY